MSKLNTNVSVVDYLKSQKQDSSFASRQGLATQYGINNYTGTAQQNTQLLGFLNKPQTPVTQPTVPKVAAPKAVAPKPVAPAPKSTNTVTNKQLAEIDPNKYRTESATIDDIAKKYGFDFSREYAARQAEAEAQAKRDAANQGKRAVDSRVEGAADALDRNYFQQMMQQQQSQTNSGLNAGIASDQDLRMAMSRQANMGDIYRDANLEHMRLQDELGRVDTERLAREESMFNDRLMQGAGLAQNFDSWNLAQNQAMMQNAIQQRGQNIGMDQFNRGFDRSIFESDRNFGFQQERAQVGDDQWLKQFLEGQRQFDTGLDWDKHQFNNLSAYQRQALAKQGSGGGGGGQNYSKMYQDLLQQLYNQEKAAEQNRINTTSNYQVNRATTPNHRQTTPYRPQY